MDAPTSRQQLLQALPALFPGDDNIGFCGDAAAVIYQMPEDGAAGLLALPEPYRKAAIQAAVRGGWASCDMLARCSNCTVSHVFKII
jgi:hypothetical protein